jgi:predicted permease
VEGVARTFGIPFWRSNTIDVFVPGRDSLGGLGSFYQNVVTADYFATTGTRVLRGRPFTETDRARPTEVVVVSETLARKVWSGGDPIGQCVQVGVDTVPCAHVVGIVKDVRWGSLGDDDRMQIYQPMALDDAGILFLRASGDPAALIEPLRQRLQPLLPGAGYLNIRVLSSTLEMVLRPWRLGATMFTLFGVLALLVAAVGLYGVIAYSVAQRTQEVGVRMALGASRGRVVGLVLADGLRVAIAGIALGTVAALVVGRFAAAMLFGVSPHDAGTLVGVGVTLLTVAAAASLVPAWRAAAVDPNAALRSE